MCKRFDAYGWHTQGVDDANDLDALSRRSKTRSRKTNRPSLIRVRSHHRLRQSAPAGHLEGARPAARRRRGQADQANSTDGPTEPAFYVPDEALSAFPRMRRARRANSNANGTRRFETLRQGASGRGRRSSRRCWRANCRKDGTPSCRQFTPKDTLATRESASRAEAGDREESLEPVRRLGRPERIDLHRHEGRRRFRARHDYAGRNLHFGIREHGMCAILNGVALHGGFIPYGSSFLMLHRLCRPVDSAGGADGHPRDLRLHPRFDRRGRGRPDASADRAALAALRAIPQSHRDSARRRQRGRRGVARRHDASRAARCCWRCRGRKLPTLDRTEMAPARELRARRLRAQRDQGARARRSF